MNKHFLVSRFIVEKYLLSPNRSLSRVGEVLNYAEHATHMIVFEQSEVISEAIPLHESLNVRIAFPVGGFLNAYFERLHFMLIQLRIGAWPYQHLKSTSSPPK
jgi:hypothetical protein